MERNRIIRLNILMILGFLLLWNQHAFAQKVTLTGTVLDERTGKPLPFANVFINNSTIGANADENGKYTLPNLEIGNLDVGVSFLGFETIRQTLRFETPGIKKVVFKMKEGMELQGVTVVAKRNKRRERNLKIITRELLGTNSFAKQSKIINPEVIRISEEDDGHLTAQSIKPVIIENYALGYRIYQDLDDFDFYAGKLLYGGSTRFELLKPKDEAQKKLWRANQKLAYVGSTKHLLASMVADSLIEEGFKVYQVIPDSLRIFNTVRSYNGQNLFSNHLHNRVEAIRGMRLVRPGELETERYVVSLTGLEVFYTKKRARSPYSDMPYAFTKITLPNKYMVITPQGWVVMPNGFEVAGDLGMQRFSNLLPADWKKED